MGDSPGALTQSEVSAYEKLPSPLSILKYSGGKYSLVLVSDGFCSLIGETRDYIYENFAADPSAAVLDEDRENSKSVCEYAQLSPGDESRTVLRLKKRSHGSAVVSCSATSRRTPDGAYLLFLSYIPATSNAPSDDGEPRICGRPGSELAYLGGDREYYLIATWHCDLTRNVTLEYTPLCSRALKISLSDTYDESSAFVAGMPHSHENRNKLASLLDRQKLVELFAKGETAFSLEYRRDEDGVMPFWVSTVISTFRSPATGNIECSISSFDVTEKILESQLISRLTVLGYDAVGLIYIKTNKCRYFRIKRMHLGMVFEHYEDYRYSIESDIQRIVAPDQRDFVSDALKLDTLIKNLAVSPIYSVPYSMTTSDGRHLQKLLQFSYLDGTKDTIFLCKSDITKQYRNEHEQIERLREAKLEADRANSAKSMFLSSMSHDLRTPLNGIIGFTNLAINESDPVKKQDYLNKVKSSGTLLLDLVSDTLELSRIESGKSVLSPEAVSIREMAEAVVTALGPSAEIKNLALKADPAAFPDKVVWTDRLKFQKIFLNLLSNAIKYTPSGGSVSASIVMLDPPVDGRNCRVTVSDNGIGIAEEFLPHIFDAFAQEHRPESANVLGTGLGLAIVKKTVGIMGGAIGVESKAGKGSTFTVDLPLEEARDAQIGSKARADTSASLKGRHILLCEDNYLNTEIAKILLEDKGMTVDCAKNGRLGIELYRDSVPGHYAAILMDIRMPVMDGCEAARLIRRMQRPDAASIPIIAMTADAFEEDIRNCIAAGMNAHVTKPIDPKKLFAALCEFINPAQ